MSIHSTEDAAREGLVMSVVLLLFVMGIRLRSFVIGIIAMVMFIQHAVQWPAEEYPLSQGILPSWLIKVGAAVLAVSGLYHDSIIVSYAGTYSLLSKFKYRSETIPMSDIIHEIFKALLSIVVTAILILARRRFRKGRGENEDIPLLSPIPKNV